MSLDNMMALLHGGSSFLYFSSIFTVLAAGIVSGEWISSFTHAAHRCTIDRVPIDALSKAEFVQFYEEKYPVILLGTTQARLASLTDKDRLIKEHGNTVVTLSSSNTFSHGRQSVPLRKYLADMSTDASNPDSANKLPANESFYLFGPHAALSPKLSSLVETYLPPPFSSDDLAFSFGIGGPGTGIPFHIHGHGFSEVIHGGKRWMLFPPDHRPPFDPDEPVADWLELVYPTLAGLDAELLEECNIAPGEVLYFPSNWWHAVINLGETVFVSSFERQGQASKRAGLGAKLGL